MFNTQQNTTAQYGNDIAGTFLQDSYQQSISGGTGGGLIGNQFSSVMNSISSGVTTNAQNGNIGASGENLTPQQIAAQMNTSGVMSVLPFIGGTALPKLMFPIAGLWSLVSGVKAVGSFISGAKAERSTNVGFDPNKLAYNQTMNEMYEVSQKWSSLGPFSAHSGSYGY